MGFENIRCRYDNEQSQQDYSSSQESPSLVIEVLRFVVQAFLWVYVFIVETFRLVLDLIEEFLDDLWRFLQLSYFGGGFFYALLHFAPKIEDLFLHFSVGDLFSLVFGVVFVIVFWFIKIILFEVPWIVFVLAMLIAYYIQKRDYDSPPKVFWIWSIVAAFVYIMQFI